MVKTQLTPELIEEGRALIEGLDSAGVSPDAALWFFFQDIGAWKLLLTEVKVGAWSPRGLYRAVQKTLRSLRGQVTHLSLEDIALAKPDAPVVRLLGQAVAVRPGTGGIRLTRNVIDGTLIEDAHIYRLKMKRIRVTVEPKGHDWVVRRGRQILSQHAAKTPAVQSGIRRARATQNSQLVIKNQDGRIREERTYGNDPFPPKG